MKTALISLFFALITLTEATAQDNPYLFSGRTFLGGGISLSFSGDVPENDDPAISQVNRRFSGSLSPTYGRFYNDRWAAGVSLTFGYVRDLREITGPNSVDENQNWQTTVGITPFLRRFLPITERFGAFVQPEISYQYRVLTLRQERTNDELPQANSFSETIDRRHVGTLGLRAGLYYFITKRFNVETNLGQLAFTLSAGSSESTTADSQVSASSESTEFNAQLNLINQLSLNQVFILNYYF